MKVLSNLNLFKNELQNAVIQNLAAPPTNPKLGQIYFNTGLNRLMLNGPSGWIDISAVTNVAGTDPVVVSKSGDEFTVSVNLATTSKSGLLSATDKTQLNNLQGNLDLKAPLNSPVFTGLPKVRSAVSKINGNATDNAFLVESSTQEPLFEVKTNGDTVIAGVLTVNGTGDSSFAGNVNIGGSLNVDGNITGGTQVSLAEDLIIDGNLKVHGNTILGDDPTQDSTKIRGFTKVTSKINKSTGSSSTSAFLVESLDSQPLFEVMENGDAKIAGVLTVSGVNSSGGDEGTPGATLEGDTVVDNLTVRHNLDVWGNTTLGNNASTDTTDVKGLTTIHSKTTKELGSELTPTFQVKASDGEQLFEVMENGDTVIAGVLKVKGTGESEFAGNVKIGGNLTVDGDATVKGIMSGDDFNIQGNLLVDGSTTLGNNSAEDTTHINGFTSIKTPGTKSSSGASDRTVFIIEDSSTTPNPLFEVKQNGDTVIGGSLTVSGDISGGGTSTQDLVVQGNLLVKGDTTLGDEVSDKINIIGELTASQNIKMSGNRITGVAEPINGSDAATKSYVDATAQGLDAKDSVRAATTSNITLSGVQTIDGVSLSSGDRVLVKNQTTKSANGIYVVGSGSWVRSSDANSSDYVNAGMFTFVEEGTRNADTGWVLSTNGAITLGSTALEFVQFSGSGTYSAGHGLTKDGSEFSVVGTSNRIAVNSSGVDIASNYVGQTSITTLGSITTGTWNANTIALSRGGTGSTTATGARSNLGATGKYATDIGNGTATEITVTHNLNSSDVVVQIYEKSTNQMVFTDVDIVNNNSIKVYFGTAPSTNAFRVVVVG